MEAICNHPKVPDCGHPMTCPDCKLFIVWINREGMKRTLARGERMRQAIVILLLLAVPGLAQESTKDDTPAIMKAIQDAKPAMVQPTVKHHDEVSTQHYDRVEVTCPAGYEGHFVDMQKGFGFEYWYGGTGFMIGQPPGYTVCFSDEFMKKLRANPEMLRARPEPPHPV
jgi:hypothetical protein